MNRNARPRATYANVVATLALVLALGGTSYAASTLPRHSVGTPQLREGAVTSAKVRDGQIAPADLSAASRRLAAKGPVSPSIVSGVMYGFGGSGPFSTNWRRLPISGSSNAETGNLGSAASLSPNRALMARNLAVRIDNDVPADATVQVGLVAVPAFGSEVPVLSCTITGTADAGETSCTSTGSGEVPPASLMFMLITISGGSSATNAPGSIRWGLALEEKR